MLQKFCNISRRKPRSFWSHNLFMWTLRDTRNVRTLEFIYHLAHWNDCIFFKNCFNRSRSVPNGCFSIQTSFLDERQENNHLDTINLGAIFQLVCANILLSWVNCIRVYCSSSSYRCLCVSNLNVHYRHSVRADLSLAAKASKKSSFA